MKGLTDKQAAVLKYIDAHITNLGYAPSVRDLSQQFHLSIRAAYDHLRALERKGAVRRTNGVARSIVLTGKY